MHSLKRRTAAFVLTVTGVLAQTHPIGLFHEMQWRMIGPFRGGRTVAISGVPSRPGTFYMAANNGGVWKSTDYGRVWNPIFDGLATGSIGALAVATLDPDIIYVGSGEGLQRPDLSTGDGMFKSVDGGATWSHLGLPDAQQISSVIIDPTNPDRVFVAVLGHPYGPNTERGVFRTTDGGRTWQKVLYKDENTGAVDLAFDPVDAQTVYAVLWAARQMPWEIGGSFNGPGSELFRSTDGGTTWQPLTKGLPTISEGLGRIGIGTALSNPNRMYALVDASPERGGLYKSDDAGLSWKRVNSESRIWGRGSDFAGVRVDPRNPDIVYVANTSTYRSFDGGRTFTAIKGAPGGDDYHSIWVNPANPNVIELGSDQGATISVNGGRTWSSWYNQPTAQFYHVITDNRFPYWVYGGQQESGSAGVVSRSDYGEITFRDWHPVSVEEYGYVAPDPLNPNYIYGGKVTRFDQTTGSVRQVGPAVLRGGKYRFLRTAPLLFSPVDPHILYLGSQVLFQTSNGGDRWDIISPDLTRASWDMPPSVGIFATADPEKGKHRGVIYTIAPSYRDKNVIWIGTDDGLIQVTRDGGRNWSNVTPPALTPWSKVSIMDASHFDTDTAYAAVNRFRLDDLHPHIYRTHDGGKSWREIVKGLAENAPVNTVREDPVRKGLLYAGSERGVSVSFDDGENWEPLQNNLPATSIRDLVIHENDWVVGTHGRSFWILDDITPLRQMSSWTAPEARLFAPEPAWRVRNNQNPDTPLPPEEPAGQNPPDGAILHYYLPENTTGPATLDILDSKNQLIRRYSSTDKPEPIEPDLNVPTYWIRPDAILAATPGLHRFVWDLHETAPDVFSHEYPIAAVFADTPRLPEGPVVLPGQYTVRLSVGKFSSSQPLLVKMDPRVKASAGALAQQHDLASQITQLLHRDYEGVTRIRVLRAQLKKLAAPGPAAAEAAALDAKAASLIGAGSSSSAATEDLSRANNELAQLLALIDSADAAPTPQAVATVDDLQKSTEGLLGRWRDLETNDIPALNRKLKQAHLQPLP